MVQGFNFVEAIKGEEKERGSSNLIWTVAEIVASLICEIVQIFKYNLYFMALRMQLEA